MLETETSGPERNSLATHEWQNIISYNGKWMAAWTTDTYYVVCKYIIVSYMEIVFEIIICNMQLATKTVLHVR